MPQDAGIIVVDDERGIRDLLSYELSSRGYRIATASNGSEALRLLSGGDFQLVISDVRMPKMDGLAFLEAVKSTTPNIEVIIMTGFATVELAVDAMKNGAYDFIQKPFNLDELMILIEKSLERRELKALVAMYEASRAVFASDRFEDMLQVIVRITAELLKADDASVLMVRGADLEFSASWGLASEDNRRARLALGALHLPDISARREAIICPGPEPASTASPARQTAILQPLHIGGELLGLLEVVRTSRAEPFHNSDLHNLSVFASQVVQALANARALRNLEQLQTQMAQADRSSAIGTMAAAVAHELNNPLTGILGSAQLLMESHGLTQVQRDDLNCILEQVHRCRHITEDLMRFSERREPKLAEVDLAELLNMSLRLSRFDLDQDIEIIKELPSDPRRIRADPMRLKQVFINLIRNAIQAMSHSPVKKLEIRLDWHPESVHIHFRDTGCGIPKEHQARLFKPFFTTKEAGKGTGLGLSICRNIINRHGGSIAVESAPGAGTVFTIELPTNSPDKGAAPIP
ncbi:MAG: ATP-binding protein [Elusimicrobiota bacterium]|jgi:signal transduction histidine kinase